MAADASGKTSHPVQCIVYFLDDSYETFDLERREKAQVLLNKVCDHLDISEKKYFGLQFYDTMTSEENLAGCDEVELIRWVDPSKSVKKQLKTLPPFCFYFRVKFYVPEPDLLAEEYTRFYYFLQCNKDISAGKLKVPDNDLLYLAAYSAQSELGDFSVTEHSSNTAYHFDYLNNKPPDFVNQVRQLHKQLKGTRPVDCEMRFLKVVRQADTYGVNLYKATLEQSCREIQIGVTAKGLLVFSKETRTNTFKWADIIKLSFKRKLFFIHLHKPAASFITQVETAASTTSTATSENIYGFHMSCYRSCKNLWKACVEHHTFFCLHSQQQQQLQNKQQQQQLVDKQQQQQQILRNKQLQHKLDGIVSDSNNNKFGHSSKNNNTNNYTGVSSLTFTKAKNRLAVVRTASSKSPSTSPPLDLSDNTTVSLAFLPISTTRLTTPSSLQTSNHSLNQPSMQPPTPTTRSFGNPPSATTTTSSSSTTHYMFDLPPTISTTSTSSTQPPNKATTATTTYRKNFPILNRSTAFRSTHTTELLEHNPQQPPQASSFKSIFIVSDDNKNNNINKNTNNDVIMDVNDVSMSIYDNSLDMEIPINSDVSDNNNKNNNSSNNNRDGRGNNRSIGGGGSAKHPSDRKRFFEPKHILDPAESSEDEDGKVIDKPDAKTITTLSPIVMLSNNNNNNNNNLFNNEVRSNQYSSSDLESRQDASRKNKSSQPSSLPSKLLLATTSPSSSSSSSKESRVDSRGTGGRSVLEGLISVRMKPDAQGRFGFNVKGGSDLQQAIVVSRVAPNSPADVCTPNLCEGDHVLFINGRDVSQHTHAQVVQFIRASRETHSGELVLVIQRNAYLNDTSPGEPDFQYIPDSHHMVAILPPQADALAASIFLLRESLESGSGLAQFEQLYRKKAGMSMTSSQLPINLCKNRYRDISPYDATRVRLQGHPCDYINASYVNMHIPSTSITNHYIATQGPLPNTTQDFWNMVVQEGSTLIIMLTVTVERGRTKCHKYWPDLDTCLVFKNHNNNNNNNRDGDFNLISSIDRNSTNNKNNNNNNNKKLCVTNVSETYPCDSYVCREFILSYEDDDDDDGGDDDDRPDASVDGVLREGRSPKRTTTTSDYNHSPTSHNHSTSVTPTSNHHTSSTNLSSWVRKVTQLQYTAWPDHGVPDDCSDFLEFVDLVGRLKQQGGGAGAGAAVEERPCIVHCSAGIGRTGVLIAMETATSLMHTHQPVHLLDVVRQMREQRAMLIQTSSQYKFVCEAILKVYDEKLVVPLDKHKRL